VMRNKGIDRLAYRSLKANKKRNFFVVTAIALTAFMITTVFSVSMSIAESVQLQVMRLQGSKTHIAFVLPGNQQERNIQLERLGELDYVETYGFGSHVGETLNAQTMTQLTMAYFDEMLFREFHAPAWTDIVGAYPRQKNEIMASRWTLEHIGVNAPEIGMTLPISFSIWGDAEIWEESFVLSGFYTSFDHFQRGEAYFLVSEILFQRFEESLYNYGTVNVLFQDGNRLEYYIERLAEDLPLSFEQQQSLVLHPAFDLDYSEHIMTIIAIILAVAFLMFTGYLLIYNVFYISVSQDVRFYGLLKTVGATQRQIRRIVIMQAMRLYVFGVGIGIICGTMVSFILVPLFTADMQTGSIVSFSPLIYTGAILFTLLTTFFAALSPAKKAASISPIEAVRYFGKVGGKASKSTRAYGKPYRMAFRNVFRDSNRAIIVFLSLFLGLTTFVLVTTGVLSMDTEKYVNSQVEHDFVLRDDGFLFHLIDEPRPLNQSFLDQIHLLPGIQEVHIVTNEIVVIDYQIAFEAHIDTLRAETDIDWTSEELIERGLGGPVFGIDDTATIQFNVNFDRDGFEHGEFALIATNNPELFSEVIDISGFIYSNGNTFTVPLGGFVEMDSIRWHTPYSGAAPIILVSNELIKELIDFPRIISVRINVQEGYDTQVFNALRGMIRDSANISMRSRIEERQIFEDARMVLFILGSGISLILGGIGILNFVNSISVGVLARKREIAALESIGMTKKQLRTMLISEGVWYSVITFVLVALVGNGIAIGIYRLVELQLSDWMTFSYPFIPILAIFLIVLTISIVVPFILYRSINKLSIAERIREQV